MAKINHDTAELWQAWQRRELRFARCQDCGTWIHLPRKVCPQCWSDCIATEAVDGTGHLLSYSLPRRGPDATEATITGVVTIDSALGVRLLARIVGCSVDQIEIGMPLVLDWRSEDGTVVPQFRPVGVR